MNEAEQIEQIKSKIIELLSAMGFSAKGGSAFGGEAQVFERQEEGRTVFNIKTSDAQLLIGRQGANLEALQHIVRLLLRRHSELERVPFALDVDDYRDKRVIYLKELARKAAHQVRSTGRGVALEPMPSYERKIVHNYLSLYSDISSQSTGEEPGRRIVIKPKKLDKQSDDFKFIENL